MYNFYRTPALRVVMIFELNALVVVKSDEIVDERTSLRKRGKLVAVHTFRLENGKEFLSHGIVVAVATS